MLNSRIGRRMRRERRCKFTKQGNGFSHLIQLSFVASRIRRPSRYVMTNVMDAMKFESPTPTGNEG